MKKKKEQLTVAVTGLNAIDSPGPGVPVIRCLRDCPDRSFRIVGLSYDALEPGNYLHHIVNKTYQIPYPSAGRQALLNRLLHIHAIETLDVVIPNFDAELFSFIKLSGKLGQRGIRTFLPTIEQFEAREKIRLCEFCKKHGFDAPRDSVACRVDDLRGAAEEFGFPLVVKGKFYEATVAHTLEQAQAAYHGLAAKWGLPVIVQEFLRGTEINIAVLGDGKGRAISAIPMRKLYITDKGKAWAGITLQDESLIGLAHRFIRATKWRGGLELEIMQTPDGKAHIMEINPRFPAWIYLTAAAGHNQPGALLRMALGENVKPYGEYAVGKIFVRYSWDHITDVNEFQRISAFGEL